MKQILMSKEEYDQLILDMENLKKENEQLKEQNAKLNKEKDGFKQAIVKGEAANNMYLNQITTRYASLDIKLFVDKLKREANISFSKFERNTGNFVIMTPVMSFFDSIDETFIKGCLKTEAEETEYGFCIAEQLLYGTLLQAKFSEVSKLEWKVFQLKEEINKISGERDRCISNLRQKDIYMTDLIQDYNNCRENLLDAIKQKEKYQKEIKSLSQQVQSLTKEINNYESNYIKLPKWAMKIMKHLKRDKKNE